MCLHSHQHKQVRVQTQQLQGKHSEKNLWGGQGVVSVVKRLSVM